jgi:hypothetical protein
MITTHTQITILDGLKLLVASKNVPIEGYAFKRLPDDEWGKPFSLSGVKGSIFYHDGDLGEYVAEYCAKVIEIDPCKSPDGCPELEPWMAYVGYAPNPTRTIAGTNFFNAGESRWLSGYCGDAASPYAIDVRKEWSQREFPEHCKQRSYVEPDAFEEWLAKQKAPSVSIGFDNFQLREAFELGQANPKP